MEVAPVSDGPVLGACRFLVLGNPGPAEPWVCQCRIYNASPSIWQSGATETTRPRPMRSFTAAARSASIRQPDGSCKPPNEKELYRPFAGWPTPAWTRCFEQKR
jgi:hypothetical protein